MREKHIKYKRRRYIGICTFVFILIVYFFSLPERLFNVPYSTTVLDRDGVLMGARIASDGQWRFPESKEIPEKLKVCMVAFEDEYFYYHWGVNPVSIGKALITNIKSNRIVRGGSTITMQVIRLSRSEARTVAEKIVEAILATRLEFRYSKSRILNLYASYAPFGGNVVGFSAASWRYFGHAASDMSWAEAATLAVLPNAPSAIHLAKQRGALKSKRDRLLHKIYNQGIINEQTLELAINEPLPTEPKKLPQIAPHLVSKLAVTTPQENIHTTIDAAIQLRVEEICQRWNTEYQKHNIRDIAAIIVDIEKAEVLAYLGNSGFESNRNGSQVNVIEAPRSTGSILKPFLYTAMLDDGILLPHQLLPDIPMNIQGFSPQNFNLKYEGAVPASQALSRSLNLPSVYLLKEFTVPKFYDYLKQLGLSTLSQPASHYGLSLILGGAEGKLSEIVDCYTYLGQAATNKSIIKPSYLINREKEKQVAQFSKGAAWQVLNILTEVNRPGEIAWKRMPSMQQIAWKTGTSQGFRDAWAVGVNSKYAIGVWVGNATGEGVPDLIGGRIAGPVLFDLFNIFPNEPWMLRPENEFVDVEVCKQSGMLSSRFCTDIDTVLVTPSTIDNGKVCPYHHKITLTTDGQYRVYTSCVGLENTIQKDWFTLPPVLEWYYKKIHPEYRELPPFKKGCGDDYIKTLQFIYPSSNTEVIVTKQYDGTYGPIVFELAHIDPDAKVFWHLDGEYFGTTTLIHTMSVIPEDGNHVMTAVDTQGNTTSINFTSYKTN